MNRNNQQNRLIPIAIRRTSMGGVTLPLALRVRPGGDNNVDIVRPAKRRYSLTGSHGFFYYLVDDVDVIIVLLQSNSGSRSAMLRYCSLPYETCRRIYDIICDLWISLRSPYTYVARAIKLIKI